MKKIRDATQVFTKSPFQEQTKNLTIFNMIHWVAGLIVLLPKRLMVQVLIVVNSVVYHYFDRLNIKQWELKILCFCFFKVMKK